MGLHRLSSVTIGVPNVAATAAYYEDFGLARGEGAEFSTTEGGRQLSIVSSPRRRLVAMSVGVDDPDDLDRIASRLLAEGFEAQRMTPQRLVSADPATDVRVEIEVMDRFSQPAQPAPVYNGPGRVDRVGRAPGVLRDGPVRPRRLGHCVSGTPDFETTMRFLVDGVGFKISDRIGNKGAFLRCSTDHHNFLALAAPISYLHHTSWEVDDIDEVGRGAAQMLEQDPRRHVWGVGRHYAGSNFFWYLKDPAGNFSEYFSDMDAIPEDQIWEPETLEGAKGLFNWGPPPPPSFLAPEDLAALMTDSHSS